MARPHLKSLEEIEWDCIPGLVQVLRTERVESVRYALWEMTRWHERYDPCIWRSRSTDEQKRVGWEMSQRPRRSRQRKLWMLLPRVLRASTDSTLSPRSRSVGGGRSRRVYPYTVLRFSRISERYAASSSEKSLPYFLSTGTRSQLIVSSIEEWVARCMSEVASETPG